MNKKPHQLLFVGDDARDWRSAINSATIYIHTKWVGALPKGVTAIAADSPDAVRRFISHFLIPPARWVYTLDRPEIGLHVRSLLGSRANLPATKIDPPKVPLTFTLQDIFTYNVKAQVGPYPARDLLMVHAITSLYLEGLIDPSSWFAVYPSSTPGKKSPLLREFLRSVAKIFHGFFKEDLLFRAVQAVDSSLEKATAKREGRAPNIPETNQTNTVHVHPDYKNKLRGRSVIVFDDFTTTGGSLEWARNILYAAGTGQVVLLTIGKYPLPYVIYERKPNSIIMPFQLRNYTLSELFEKRPVNIPQNIAAQQLLIDSFSYWTRKQSLPSGK